VGFVPRLRGLSRLERLAEDAGDKAGLAPDLVAAADRMDVSDACLDGRAFSQLIAAAPKTRPLASKNRHQLGLHEKDEIIFLITHALTQLKTT
jgi:hypothetical protein